jgi:hypothetical protein
MSIQTVSEGIHYELVPADELDNEQAWNVRILEGDYVETVIRFGNIGVDIENEALTFNFMVVYTPDDTLSEDDVDLQEYAGTILDNILSNAIEQDALVMGKPNDDD